MMKVNIIHHLKKCQFLRASMETLVCVIRVINGGKYNSFQLSKSDLMMIQGNLGSIPMTLVLFAVTDDIDVIFVCDTLKWLLVSTKHAFQQYLCSISASK